MKKVQQSLVATPHSKELKCEEAIQIPASLEGHGPLVLKVPTPMDYYTEKYGK